MFGSEKFRTAGPTSGARISGGPQEKGKRNRGKEAGGGSEIQAHDNNDCSNDEGDCESNNTRVRRDE